MQVGDLVKCVSIYGTYLDTVLGLHELGMSFMGPSDVGIIIEIKFITKSEHGKKAITRVMTPYGTGWCYQDEIKRL